MVRSLKRAVVAIAAAGAALAALAPAHAQTRSIRFQVTGDAAETAAFRELVAAFEAANPGTQIDFVAVGKPRDHMARLATGFAAGDPPDVFLVNFRRFAQFAARGVLEPLGPALAARGRFKESDYFEATTEAFRLNGQLVCAPSNAATLVVYYNTALLKKAGLPPPPPNWTWADFQRYAKAMTSPPRPDGRIDVYGFGVERLLIRIAPLVWSAGGDIVDNLDKPTRLTFDTPEAAEAITFFRSFLVAGQAPALAESKSEEYEARFARGGLAMTFNSRRFTPILRAVPNLEWDVAPLPVGKRPATSLHSDGYCVAKSSPNKDVAVRFVEFAAGPAGSAILARGGRIVPALKSVAASADFLDPSKPPRSSKVFLDVLAHARRTPNVPAWNEVEGRGEAVVADWYFQLDRTPADLAKALDAATRPVLAAGAR